MKFKKPCDSLLSVFDAWTSFNQLQLQGVFYLQDVVEIDLLSAVHIVVGQSFQVETSGFLCMNENYLDWPRSSACAQLRTSLYSVSFKGVDQHLLLFCWLTWLKMRGNCSTWLQLWVLDHTRCFFACSIYKMRIHTSVYMQHDGRMDCRVIQKQQEVSFYLHHHT